MSLRLVLSLLLFLPTLPVGAVTLGEALAAEQLVHRVDTLSPAERAGFIGQHRGELNQALAIQQIVAAIAHTMEVASQASLHEYRQPLLCPRNAVEPADEEDEAAGPPSSPMPDLAAMSVGFKMRLRRDLALPDNEATEARLDSLDVTDLIVNGMLEEQKCHVRNKTGK